MMIENGTVAFALAVLLVLVAQVAGLAGFVEAFRWLWGGAVALGALGAVLARRDTRI